MRFKSLDPDKKKAKKSILSNQSLCNEYLAARRLEIGNSEDIFFK